MLNLFLHGGCYGNKMLRHVLPVQYIYSIFSVYFDDRVSHSKMALTNVAECCSTLMEKHIWLSELLITPVVKWIHETI